MDDIIYFLLLVGWLAFSFYQQSAKKKKKLEEMKAAQERQKSMQDKVENEVIYQNETHGAPVVAEEKKPDFKSVLEEILLGEKMSLEDIPEQEAQSLESIPEAEFSREEEIEEQNMYQKYFEREMLSEIKDEAIFQMDKMQDEDDELVISEPVEVHEEDFNETHAFNLRQAIIYSEILNRRYTN